ncbi:terminase family protein [uncultured Algimonas sp.]|uniref:DNA-packaging protein n=1 Tax=uncultured Algimonas sp. TaxID=1547920 RepID=UPI0026231D60|nr:terminase family protein [uncultured Algimonas sp.]
MHSGLSTRRFRTSDLSPEHRAYVASNWHGSARPDQVEPDDPDWAVWLVLGGRGSGKTRTGAEWVLDRVRRGARRIALVGPTLHDAREVMLGGQSGLMRVAQANLRPRFEPTRRRVVFPDDDHGPGAVAHLFSAHEPDSLRGPQFDCAWGDEFCAWKDPDAVLSNLRLGLRLSTKTGARPRLCLTTTPKPGTALDRLAAQSGTRLVRSRTRDNADHLAPGFVERMEETYGGTALGRQELDGEIVRDHPGAVFARTDIDAHRVAEAPPLDRILVALDPPATSGPKADACGIVVAGAAGRGRKAQAYVLHDASVAGATPQAWAERAVAAYREFGAEAILAETNQGGEMIEAVIREVGPDVPVLRRHARRSKRGRAVPVGLLYARGRVRHVGRMDALEDELCSFGGPHASGSPDRMDALVWAVSELLLDRPAPKVHLF